MAEKMGKVLPPLEIIRAVDHAGNKDGMASLEDIQPHLDSQEKIDLKDSSSFHRALADLNRICRQPAAPFHMPAVLRCSVFQDGRLDAGRLAQAQNAFIRPQFDRAFQNEHSDNLIRARYAEFLAFVERNRVPLPDLYGVLVNIRDFSIPIEDVLSQNVFYVGNQMDALFQLSTYAAVWHLKHNVRAFAEEALTQYPDWFQRKVKGFEEAVLKRLENWELSPDLGKKGVLPIPHYEPLAEKIVTPASNPFPPILGDAISIIWHETFHAHQDTPPLAAMSSWVAERDATLVEAIAFLKMEKVTDPSDIPVLKKLAVKYWLGFTSAEGRRDQTAWEKNMEAGLLKYRYAIHFMNRRANRALQAAFERSKAEHVLQIAFGKVYKNYQPFTSKSKNDHEKYLLFGKFRSASEARIQTIEHGTYEWMEENGSRTSITFAEMLRRTNALLEARSGELDQETLSRLSPILEITSEYIHHLTAREMFGGMAKKYEEGKPGWRRIYYFRDLPKTLQFLERYKWLSGSAYANP